MDTHFVAQLLAYFKATFGLEINSAEELFETQRNLLEYLVCLGRELENEVFEQLGKGYEGATIEKDSKKYKFVGYRDNTIHGLFGEICYQRACYVSREEQGESWIPLDERLGIQKRHTPGCNCFLSSFTGREAYQESPNRFHEIGFRDAKIGVISEAHWDPVRSEAYCTDSSYVGGIEHADELFRRVWVKMNRRTRQPEKIRIVFLADGANWIWDRVPELANDSSVLILDFYHATEHLSALCKVLYGEQSEEYWRHFTGWREWFLEGKVQEVITELKQIRAGCKGQKRDVLQGHINYFQDNKGRMRYDRYRAMQLPIGSGTVESSCKNVIGGRMKQGGMTWSESGAAGMLQIRTSLASDPFLQDFRDTLRRAA